MKIVRHESGPRFSEMVVVDTGSTRTLYLSGQVAEDPSLDITGQTRDVLGHIDRLLALEGASKTNLVSVTVYLRSVGDYAAMNAVWDEWVAPGQAPARATVEARLIDSDYRIEIQATAVMAVESGGRGGPASPSSSSTAECDIRDFRIAQQGAFGHEAIEFGPSQS